MALLAHRVAAELVHLAVELGELADVKIEPPVIVVIEPGRACGPAIKIQTGYEIFKIDDHTKAGLAPLADVKSEIENALYGPKMQPKIREYLTRLRLQAYLQIKPGFLDTGAAPNQDTKWQDPAVLKPETVTKAEVEEKTRRKRLLWVVPIPGTSTTVTGKSSSR